MAAKNPSNLTLLTEIKKMQTTLEKYDGRIGHLETWRITSEAANQAVEHYKHEMESNSENKTKMDVLKAILPFVVALTALAYALITYLGRVK